MCDLFSLFSSVLLSVWTCEGKPKKDKKELLTEWTWTQTQTHDFRGVNTPLAGSRQSKHFTLTEASVQKRERLWWTGKVSVEKLTGCEESQRQWEQAAITVGRLFQYRDRNSFCCELEKMCLPSGVGTAVACIQPYKCSQEEFSQALTIWASQKQWLIDELLSRLKCAIKNSSEKQIVAVSLQTE